MLSKEKLVSLLLGMAYNHGQLASRSFLESKSWHDLQAIYDGEIQRVLAANTPEAIAARETTAELEREKVVMQQEKMQRDYVQKNTPQPDEKYNREIFQKVCRQHNISLVAANYSLLLDHFKGNFFDAFAVGQAVPKLGLIPATEQEKSQWAQEAEQSSREAAIARQKWLQTQATPAQLRESVRLERQTQRTPAQIELERQIAISWERELPNNFPPLPATWNGKVLDSAFIRDASTTTLRNLLSRFGNSRVTARFRNLKSVQADLPDGRGVAYKIED
jgi:hypothetical protein